MAGGSSDESKPSRLPTSVERWAGLGATDSINRLVGSSTLEAFRRLSGAANPAIARIQASTAWQRDLFGQGSAFAALNRATDFARFLPKPMQLPAFGMSSELTRLLSGNSAFAALGEARWTATILESSNMTAFASIQRDVLPQGFSRQMAQYSLGLTRTLRQVSDSNLDIGLQRPAALAARAWRLVVDDLPDSMPATAFGRVASAATEALATANAVATLGGICPDFEVPEPGNGAIALPTDVRSQLRTGLHDLNPALVRRLDGAWERVQATGVDATSQACHSVQELLDWTLRLAAPDSAVLDWHVEGQRDPNELHNGKPTRVLRAKYMLRHRSAESKAARLYLRSINDVVGVLQSGKHDLDEAHTPHAVGCVLVTVEALLAFLLFEN